MPLQSIRLYLHSLWSGTTPVPEGRHKVRPAGHKSEIEQLWGVSKEGRPQSPLFGRWGMGSRGRANRNALPLVFLGGSGGPFLTSRMAPQEFAPWGQQHAKNGPPRYTGIKNCKKGAPPRWVTPLCCSMGLLRADLSPWRPSRSAPHSRRCRPRWRRRRRPRHSRCRPEPRRRRWSCR